MPVLGQDAAFKSCCLRFGGYDGTRRKHYSREIRLFSYTAGKNFPVWRLTRRRYRVAN